ncbi:MAG TPA: DUF2637 domain-containing protein [Cellulomonas sp.]
MTQDRQDPASTITARPGSSATVQEPAGRPPRQGFAAALWPGLWLAGMLAVLAFAVSFVALRAVGLSIGIGEQIAWMFPVIIDGFIVLATWAVWRFKAQGLRASWYPSLALVAFSAVSLTGNALHAHPVETGGLLLTRWAAAAFSTVPPLALLAASHMLVMIVTHRTDHDRPATVGRTVTGTPVERPAGPVTATVQTSDAHAPATPVTTDRPTTARPSGADHRPITVTDGRPTLSGQPVARPAPTTATGSPTARPGRPAVRAGDGDLVRWVSARVSAGQAVSGPQAVAAGVVASESTARRRLHQLRLDRPELFAPGTAQGGAVAPEPAGALGAPVLSLVGEAR